MFSGKFDVFSFDILKRYKILMMLNYECVRKVLKFYKILFCVFSKILIFCLYLNSDFF